MGLTPLRRIEHNLSEIKCHLLSFVRFKKRDFLLQFPFISPNWFHKYDANGVWPPSPQESSPAWSVDNQWGLDVLLLKYRSEASTGNKIGSIGFRTIPWANKRIARIFLKNTLFWKQFFWLNLSKA